MSNGFTNKEIVCLPEDLDLKTLSHELRTPLVPILAFAQELLEAELTSAQRSQVSDILEAGNRLLRLANKVNKAEKIASNTTLTDKEWRVFISLLADKSGLKDSAKKVSLRMFN